MKELKDRLKEELKPLYHKMYEHCEPYCSSWEEKNDNKYIVPFILQWGKNFPTSENEGILFVGRATNDWLTENRDVDVLFDGSEDERIFNKPDQMVWAEDYNSPFWRVIRKVSSAIYPEGNALNFVAWSNLCKLAPTTGNPNCTLYNLQLNAACDILNKEVEVLSPKFIIMMTGICWADGFISGLNNDVWPEDKIIKEVTWSDYNATVFKIGERYVILTEHPQGKDEEAHINCLINIINEYK